MPKFLINKLFISYAILLHALLALTVIKPAWLMKALGRTDQHHAQMLVIHSRIDPSVPDKASIFLGDSIIEGLATAAVAPNSVNFGIGRQTTDKLLESIKRYKSIDRASEIYLLIGINDFLQNKKEGLQGRLQEISKSIPLEKRLIWSGIMPTLPNKIVSPTEIQLVNKYIKELCDIRARCVYVDTWEAIEPMREKAFTDGIHLSPAGYKEWIKKLREARNHSLSVDNQ